jgi:hypothetical protein
VRDVQRREHVAGRIDALDRRQERRRDVGVGRVRIGRGYSAPTKTWPSAPIVITTSTARTAPLNSARRLKPAIAMMNTPA